MWDLKFVKSEHDLVVGSHGRGMWVLDNLTALEELDSSIESKALHVFTLQPAMQWQIWNRGGFSVGDWTAPNPPNGVAIDYYLKSEIKPPEEQTRQHHGPVKITITDSSGQPRGHRVRPVQGRHQPSRLDDAVRGPQAPDVRARGAAQRVF